MNDIIRESKAVFSSLEKWTALYEINQQVPAIIDHWLTSGADALRKDFCKNPTQGWKCSDWGTKRDSRWYLADFGSESVGFGFGWGEFEFHLHLERSGPFEWNKAINLLGEPEFIPLLSLFGADYSSTPHRGKNGSLCSDCSFNPFSDAGDLNLRRHIIAWHAVHDQANFVAKMSHKVRQITEDDSIAELIRKLNRRSKKGSAS